MANIVLLKLKVAYKGVKLYQEKKQEFLDFEEDYDELYLRLAAAEPVINGLDGNLNDSLTLTLTLTQNELEKCQKYCENLITYCRRFKGFPLKALSNAIIGMGIGMLPADLQGPANDLLECVGNAGIPEKAFMKYANKIHFLMTALGASATTQVLLNQTRFPEHKKTQELEMVTTENVQMSESDNAPTASTPAASRPSRAKFASPAATIPPPALEPGLTMASILEDHINESEEEVKVILISGKKDGKGNPWMYAVWLNKIPHLLIVAYIFYAPKWLMIRRAPSNDFILKLQETGLDKGKAIMKLCCCYKKSQMINTMDRGMIMVCAHLEISIFEYIWYYQKSVTNKLLLIPYLNLLVYCFSCFCTTLTISEFKADGKAYHIQIRDSCDLWINRECKFNANEALVVIKK